MGNLNLEVFKYCPMKYGVLAAIGMLCIAAPAWAENWSPTGIVAPSGGTMSIDRDSVKRTAKNNNLISYKIRTEAEPSAQARVTGNCSTGSWRLNSNKQSGTVLLSLPKAIGGQLLQYACSMPAQITTPRRRSNHL